GQRDPKALARNEPERERLVAARARARLHVRRRSEADHRRRSVQREGDVRPREGGREQVPEEDPVHARRAPSRSHAVKAKIALAISIVATSASAANEDGVPLSPDAMIAGITISPHDASTGAWYNPAALGGISRSSVQLSTSIYTLGIREIDGLVETRLPWETRHDPLSATNF